MIGVVAKGAGLFVVLVAARIATRAIEDELELRALLHVVRIHEEARTRLFGAAS